LNETNQGFEAHLFHPGLGNEVAAGRVFADSRTLTFQSEATTLNIPVKQLLVEMGDEDGRIYFRDRQLPNLRIFTDDVSLLQDRRFLFIREQLERSLTRKEIVRRLRIMAYVVASCIALGWFCILATGLMVRSLAAKVPPGWEQKLGDERIVELKGSGLLLEDSNRVAQLALLAAPLMSVVPGGKEFKFHIMKATFPNAFALPGGHIVVTTGLLGMADNTELVGVIAHESAHLARRHHTREIISAAGPFLIFGVFLHSRSGLLNLFTKGSEFMLTQGFSQEYESEADEVGWKYLVAANIDPRGMMGIFRKFKTYEEKEKGAGVLPQAFQSHPALDKRIARLESKWKRLSNQSGFLELETVDLRQQ
jgi:Zn-dependent protease with chaperone function